MRIVVFGRSLGDDRAASVSNLFRLLAGWSTRIQVYEPFLGLIQSVLPENLPIEPYLNPSEIRGADVMVTLGGDGTLLEAVTHVGASGIPVLGINTGRLGFLTAYSGEELPDAAELFRASLAKTESRILLELKTSPNPFEPFPFALNELTVHKRDTSSMISIQVKRNQKMLNTYWADGLIISTPTGSTGYSLSCGGPILLPDVPNLVLTPIAPHNLNVRPLVISSNDHLLVRAEARGRAKIMISLDSRSEPVAAVQELSIQKADFTIQLVRRSDHDFLDTLREKLMWGNDKRN